jgi:hypothetical protein
MQKTTGVSRRKPRPFRKRSEWEAEVMMWRESGQGLKDYVKAHDLHPRTLAWWVTFLKKGVSSRSATPTNSKEKRFVPVRVVDGRSLIGKPSSTSTTKAAFEAFEVVLANGRRVRVTETYQPEALIRLLNVVEGCASC